MSGANICRFFIAYTQFARPKITLFIVGVYFNMSITTHLLLHILRGNITVAAPKIVCGSNFLACTGSCTVVIFVPQFQPIFMKHVSVVDICVHTAAAHIYPTKMYLAPELN